MDGFEPIDLAFDTVDPKGGCTHELTPIILLHGMTSCKEYWNHVSGPIADGTGRKVFRLDCRNHGDSEWSDVFDYHTMAGDVSHFMDTHDIPKAIVVGHSMGGKVAMVLALTEPKKVEKLITEDISPGIVTPLVRRFPYRYLDLLRQCLQNIPHDVDELTAKMKVHEFLKENTPSDHGNPERARFDPSTIPLKTTSEGFKWKANIDVIAKNFFGPPNRRNVLKGCYKGEALFVYGTKSTYNVIGDKDLILEMFPKASFQAIENATHLVHQEYPEEFIAAVLEFIK